MIHEIQQLIDINKQSIVNLYTKLLDFTDDCFTEDIKEISGILKLYEIILMEMKDKTHFDNEKKVVLTLMEMKEQLETELARLNDA
jgi:hypothetical protein